MAKMTISNKQFGLFKIIFLILGDMSKCSWQKVTIAGRLKQDLLKDFCSKHQLLCPPRWPELIEKQISVFQSPTNTTPQFL